MADEYPYSSRDVIRPCYTGGEPGSFHHTIYTSAAQMVADQHKWWRWLGEESLSGGTIGLHEGGGTFPCGQRRPSEHSMMRWIGFDWDQVGREHMVARITGMRNAGQMNVRSTPAGTVPRDSVLWLETGHPRYHEHLVTWRVGGQVVDNGNSRNLDLQPLDLAPGTVVQVEVRDPVGPDGIDWVRNPSTGNTATNSGYNGPRFVQTREWTVGEDGRGGIAAGGGHHRVDGERPPGRRRRGRLRGDQPPDRPRPRRHVVAERDRAPEPAQQPPPRPRRAGPGPRHAHAGRDRDRRSAVRHGRVDGRHRGADRASRAVRAADHAARRRWSTRSTSTAGTCGSIRTTTGRATRASPRSSASSGWTETAGSTTSASRSSRCRSRRSSSATPAPTSRR